MASPSVRASNKPTSKFNWKDGDIAFLKSVDEFTSEEYDTLIKPGYLHAKATQHPVIVLELSADHQHALIVTVSAYGSSKENNYLPPWRQPVHRKKSPNNFHAFRGSVTPNDKKEHLELADGAWFPKPKTSWVYMPSTFVVLSSTLKHFDKVPRRLRMTQESLKYLLGEMVKSPRFAKRWSNPDVLRMLGSKKCTTQNTHIDTSKFRPSTISPPATLSSTSAPITSKSWESSNVALSSKPIALQPITKTKQSKPTMCWAAVAKASIMVSVQS
ncbi:hypothetical protein F4804DRAFT_334642 [Jackrogersella minutella]|nr:hypothetical protein F4804DRAFT_334642 [Jackrogersella minutella]